MATIEEMQAQLDEIMATSYKITPEEEKKAELARALERQYAILDEQRSERLQAEADIACAEVRAKHKAALKDIPIEAFWSLEAYKLCGVGWLVLGPEDKGWAADALKAEGKLKGEDGVKLWESNPDTCRVAVCRATLASPVPADKLSRALMDAPKFVVSCYRKVEQLGGSQLKQAAGKSAG